MFTIRFAASCEPSPTSFIRLLRVEKYCARGLNIMRWWRRQNGNGKKADEWKKMCLVPSKSYETWATATRNIFLLNFSRLVTTHHTQSVCYALLLLLATFQDIFFFCHRHGCCWCYCSANITKKWNFCHFRYASHVENAFNAHIYADDALIKLHF